MSLKGELSRLRKVGGFAVAGAGPQGDWRLAARSARDLSVASEALAQALESPEPRVAGLGGLSVHVNVCRAGVVAAFIHRNFSLCFSYPATQFGHEWTHAMEFAVLNSSGEDTVAAQEALALASEEILKTPLNPGELRVSELRAVDRSDLIQSLVFFLEEKGTELAKLGARVEGDFAGPVALSLMDELLGVD